MGVPIYYTYGRDDDMRILMYISLIVAPFILCIWTKKAFFGYIEDSYKKNTKVK